MNKKKFPLMFSIIVILVVQLACNFTSTGVTPDTFATLNGLYTASALTLEAGGGTPIFTATPGLPLPTANTQAANTPSAQNPDPVVRCDAAQFISDVTYADGSIVARNDTFVKIWRIQNIGACPWTTSYALVFTGGALMGAPLEIALTKNVKPGETVDIQVAFTAPNKDGNYRGYWKLRNTSGILFGIGDQADINFWVDINVKGRGYTAYEFTETYCSAEWENNNNTLPCPGTQGDAKGFVVKLNSPVLENGVTENETGLLVFPLDKNNGFISGQYPAFAVQAGDHFRTIIGCQYGANNCDIVFRLDYKNNGQTKTLASWNEVYEGMYYPIDLDLSSLAGKKVKFILMVSANGGNNEDYGIWLNPHIIRQGTPPPTPTFTFTPTSIPTYTLTPSFTPTPTDTPSSTNTAIP